MDPIVKKLIKAIVPPIFFIAVGLINFLLKRTERSKKQFKSLIFIALFYFVVNLF